MSLGHGASIVRDGLILHLDNANSKNDLSVGRFQDLTDKNNGITVQVNTAISGGPVTNLAYDSNGNAIFTIGNLTASISVVETEANYKYRVTGLTGGETGQLRITIPDGILVDGEYYCISTKFQIINGYFELKDWNDQATTFVYSSDLGNGNYYQAVYAKKDDYNSTYRFIDCFISEGTVVDIYEFQIESGTTPHVFAAGERTVATSDVPMYSALTTDILISPKVSRYYDGVTLGSVFTNKTIMLGFRTGSDITSRQVVCAQGIFGRGFSYYIYNGKFYAGAWNNFSNATYPGDLWTGDWFETIIEPNTTYIITHILNNATETITSDKQELYLNDQFIGYKPGRSVILHGTETLAFHWGSQSNYELLYNDGDVDTIRQFHVFDGTPLLQIQYDRPLSAEEIKQNFEALRGRYGI